jgi:hypothetical protein
MARHGRRKLFWTRAQTDLFAGPPRLSRRDGLDLMDCPPSPGGLAATMAHAEGTECGGERTPAMIRVGERRDYRRLRKSRHHGRLATGTTRVRGRSASRWRHPASDHD